MKLNLCMGCMCEKSQPGPCPHCGFDENTYVPSPHHLLPQTILAGKYLVGRVLGEGGFGITYLGWDLNLEMKVAIKECFPNGFVTRDCGRTNAVTVMTGNRAEFYQKNLDKFVDEAKRLGKFWGLPGIVAVKDYFQENKTAYIVMEFVEGETLKALLKKQPGGRLPAEKVFEMLRPVMDSLEEVHSAGLIHRDISPDNLMIDNKGRVKLLDFGAARDFMTDGERSLSVMLKPGYAPLEQYRSRGNQGPWTDIYALCATIYRAVTGEVPPESLDRIDGEVLKKPTELGAKIKPCEEEALLKGMAVMAKDRYQTVSELIEALYDSEKNKENAENSVENCDIETDAEKAGTEKNEEQQIESEKKEIINGNSNTDEINREDIPEKRVSKWNIRAVVSAVGAALAVVVGCIVIFGKGNGESEDNFVKAEQSENTYENNDISEENQSESRAKEAVVWNDSNMERLIRMGLNRAEGDIYEEELENIKVLRICADQVRFCEDEKEDEGKLEYGGVAGSDGSILKLEDLKHFPNLSVLQISDHKVNDISALSELTALTSIDLENNAIQDISSLSLLTNLEYLDLSLNDIMKIDDLSGLTSLKYLDISSNELADIDGLSKLTALENLDLQGNEITDISGLTELVSLKSLNLEGLEISDISGLSEMILLENLNLYKNNVENIDALSKMTKMKDLNLCLNNVKDIGALSKMTSMEVLDLGYNEISDIEPLSAMTQLTILDLGNNHISDIQVLKNMTVLKDLDLNNNNISDISVLAGLTGLTDLCLWTNKITDITPLAGMTELKTLGLSHNNISDISILSKFSLLTQLDLAGLGVTDIHVLSKLTLLIDLDLSYNRISDISPLSEMTSLKSLDLYSNQVSDISKLANLSSLEHLNLSYNQVKNVNALSGLSNLVELHLINNEIADISPLKSLTELKRLVVSGDLVKNLSSLEDIEGLNIEDNY